MSVNIEQTTECSKCGEIDNSKVITIKSTLTSHAVRIKEFFKCNSCGHQSLKSTTETTCTTGELEILQFKNDSEKIKF